jgi:hypothetical protein
LLQAHSAFGGADAHEAGGIKTDQQIESSVPDGERLRFDLRGVYGKYRALLDLRVDRAGLQGHGDRAAGF